MDRRTFVATAWARRSDPGSPRSAAGDSRARPAWNPGYLAIDVPPEVRLERVVQYLTASGQQWKHADPRYSELYPDEEGERDAADG